MSETAIVVGAGELGGLFAHGLLRCGHTVVPVRRGDDPSAVAKVHPSPALVLVAVGEDDLEPALKSLPDTWRSRVALLQNELLPHAWESQGISDPSVCVVWFEKKRGKPVTELLPTAVYGPCSALLDSALTSVGIQTEVVAESAAILTALVEKNLYILTVNLAGMKTGGNVGDLFSTHRQFAITVFDEVLELQEALTEHRFDRPALLAGVEKAVAADPAHACTGRSAPRRRERALAQADRLGLTLSAIRELDP